MSQKTESEAPVKGRSTFKFRLVMTVVNQANRSGPGSIPGSMATLVSNVVEKFSTSYLN